MIKFHQKAATAHTGLTHRADCWSVVPQNSSQLDWSRQVITLTVKFKLCMYYTFFHYSKFENWGCILYLRMRLYTGNADIHTAKRYTGNDVTYTHFRFRGFRQMFMPELVCDKSIDTTLGYATSATYTVHTSLCTRRFITSGPLRLNWYRSANKRYFHVNF